MNDLRRTSRSGIIALCCLLLGSSVGVVRAQERESGQMAPSREFNATSATVEAIMNTAVRNIAIRYNLNELQKQHTEELMKREVRRFLREHEEEVWPAMRALLEYQFRAPDDPEKLKVMGEMIRPLAQKAREAIFDGNREWGEILEPDQRKLHEFDLEQMSKTFDKIDGNLAAWEKGQNPGSRLFPAPQKYADQEPPKPNQPKTRLPRDSGIVTDKPPIGILDTFVEEFIKEYKLDEGQITTAESILTEFKGKAESFYNREKEDFAKVIAAREKAKLERDMKGVRDAVAAHKKLLEPFYGLFDEMESRLVATLTSAQLEKYREKHPESEDEPRTVKNDEASDKPVAPSEAQEKEAPRESAEPEPRKVTQKDKDGD